MEASTSVLFSVRPLNTRASSSSAAVPDRSAVAGRHSASRWATTTIWRSESPARTPTTSRSVRSPTAVRAAKRRSRTRKPASTSEVRTRPASRSSPRLPGLREGYRWARSWSSANARPPENESGGSVVVRARGAGWIENAPTMNASSAGTNPAR